MTAVFSTFVGKYLRVAPNMSCSAATIVSKYIEFNGSTTGKNKLYSYLQTLEGVSKVKTQFYGIDVINSETTSLAVNTIVNDGMTEYERRMLELAVKKQEAEERRAKEQQEAEERRAKEQQEAEERRAKEQQEAEERRAKEQQEAEARRAKWKEESEARRVAHERILKDMDIAMYKEKQESMERIAKEKKESKEAIEARKIEAQLTMKQMDMDFIREENNKNRKMYIATKFNRYLDMEVFGTPKTQYVVQKSLTDIIGFNVYNALGDVNPEIEENIKTKVAEKSILVPLIENNIAKESSVVNVEDIPKIIDDVVSEITDDNKKNVSEELKAITSKAESIPEIATRDEHRYIENVYTEKKRKQDADKFKNMRPKLDYLRSINAITHGPDGIQIKCYCCQNRIKLNDAGCHRAHDIPRSDGGDCSQDNIYLTCATCNQAMGSDMSVLDYKTELYVAAIDKLST